MRQPQFLRKVSGRRLQDAVTTRPGPSLPPQPAPRHPASILTSRQHPVSTPTPRQPVVRCPDTSPAPQPPTGTRTPGWHSDSLQLSTGVPGQHPTARQPTAQPAPRHLAAPARTRAGSRLGSPGGVGDVPDEQGGVGGPGVARHAARGPAPSRPPRPLPGRPRSRRRGRGARGLSDRAITDLTTAWAAGEQTRPHPSSPRKDSGQGFERAMSKGQGPYCGHASIAQLSPGEINSIFNGEQMYTHEWGGTTTAQRL